MYKISAIVLPYEISCLDLNSFSGEIPCIAIGTWDEKKIQILFLPELRVAITDTISELVPYNIKFQNFQNILYLFVSFGNNIILFC